MNDLPVLKIEKNTIRLRINEGPDVLEFDPDDILFIEGFYLMIEQFQQKQVQYQEVLAKLESDPKTLPATTGETIAAMKEICQFAHEQINQIFGEGTSKKLFGDTLAFAPIEQFFVGVTPHIQKKRAKHLEKFMPPKSKPRRRKK